MQNYVQGRFKSSTTHKCKMALMRFATAIAINFVNNTSYFMKFMIMKVKGRANQKEDELCIIKQRVIFEIRYTANCQR